jgi:hypothetical protein
MPASQNTTGMPSALKAGLEELSGFDLSAVRLHRNSPDPARLDALAYTVGQEIRLAPGQEQHLPHEGWHVVQQMQGRVQPTAQLKGHNLNEDDSLEREADVMGARALTVGQASTADHFRATTGTASGASLDDQPFADSTTQGTAVLPNLRQSQERSRLTNIPTIQRVATFAPGPVTATKNIAAGHIARDFVNGFTPPTLNGTAVLSIAAAQGAIRRPVLNGRSNADGTVDNWVESVPTNQASFTMALPSGGPWSTSAPKSSVVALFATMGLAAQATCLTPGNSTFSINGKPTDATFAANIRTHENLHATDHQTAFNSILVPWDTRLETAKRLHTTFNAADPAAAEAALFAAMGGTPDAIASAQFLEWIRLNNLTHRGTTTATGGTATPSNSVADGTCATSSMDLT